MNGTGKVEKQNKTLRFYAECLVKEDKSQYVLTTVLVIKAINKTEARKIIKEKYNVHKIVKITKNQDELSTKRSLKTGRYGRTKVKTHAGRNKEVTIFT